MCYGMLALATDYDCWHESEEDVSVSAVIEVVKANSKLASAIVEQLCHILPDYSSDPCLEAAKFALMTSPNAISLERKKELAVLYGKYFN